MKYILPTLYLAGFILSGLSSLYAGYVDEFAKATYHLLWACIFSYSLDREMSK
jgi:hypothetical protein